MFIAKTPRRLTLHKFIVYIYMQYPPTRAPKFFILDDVLIQTYEVYSDILRDECTFLPILVRTICSVLVGWLVGVLGFLEAMSLYVSGMGKS